MNKDKEEFQLKSIFFPNWLSVLFAILAWLVPILLVFHSDFPFIQKYSFLVGLIKVYPIFIYLTFPLIILFYLFTEPFNALLFALYCFFFPFILALYGFWLILKNLYRILSFFYSLITREWAFIASFAIFFHWVCFLFYNNSNFNYLQIPSNLSFLLLFMLYQLKVAGDPLFWLNSIKWFGGGIFNWFLDMEIVESNDIKKLDTKLNTLDFFDTILTKLEEWVKKLEHSLTRVSVSSFFIVLVFLVSIVILNYAFVYRVLFEHLPNSFSFIYPDKTASFFRWLTFSFAIFSTSSYLQFIPNSTYAYFLVVSETCFSILILSFFLLNFSHLSSKSVERHIEELLELIDEKRKKIVPVREKVNELKMKLQDSSAIEIETKAVEKIEEDAKRGD
jgi:hypothetical protein